LFAGKGAGAFVGDWAVEGVSSSPPDVNMSLGHGKSTECDGLGDSKHASSLLQELDVVDLVGSGSTDYGSMPPLPSTLAEPVSRSRVSTMTSASGSGSGGLDLMEQDAQVVEVVTADSPMAMGGGCNSEGSGLEDSHHATTVSDVLGPDERLIIDRDGSYGGLPSVGLDVQYLGSVIVEMGLVIRRLERRVDELEDAADKASWVAMRGVSSPPAMPVVPAPPAVPRAPRLDKGKGRTPAPLPAKVPVGAPPLPVRPSEIPPPAAATWSQVASSGAEGGKFTLVTKRKNKASSPSPVALTERERHIIVQFEKRGAKARLPAGINTEMIKNALNRVLASGGAARFGSCVQHRTSGDILLSLVQHSAASVWGMVSCLEHALMEPGINGFSINQHRKRVKILISELPLSPLGVGAVWKPEDWHGDGAFDNLIRDLEVTNPGFNIVGRPHCIGCLTGHKAHKHTQGSVVFVVELSDSVKTCLDRRTVMVYRRRRPIRIWVELNATSVCTRCLRHGHVAVMCRAPVACKFCDGGHLSTLHQCSVRDCKAAVGSLCTHVRLACRLCLRIGHLTGDPACPDLRAPTASEVGQICPK